MSGTSGMSPVMIDIQRSAASWTIRRCRSVTMPTKSRSMWNEDRSGGGSTTTSKLWETSSPPGSDAVTVTVVLPSDTGEITKPPADLATLATPASAVRPV